MVPLPPPTTPITKREELNEIFVGLLGSRQVYFQPDEKQNIDYPAIIYEVDAQDALFADNKSYRRIDRYQVTLIDRDPDIPVRKLVEEFPMCTFTRSFTSDGLNHRIYTLYF